MKDAAWEESYNAVEACLKEEVRQKEKLFKEKEELLRQAREAEERRGIRDPVEQILPRRRETRRPPQGATNGWRRQEGRKL